MRLGTVMSLVLASAPKPYEDASADTTVGDFGWNKASTGVEMSICLRLSNSVAELFPIPNGCL